MTRRAFALPLVLLLALIVSLAGAVLLDMQTDTTRSVNRHVKVYRDHHLATGMRELLDQWLMTGGPIRERLGEDGEAFRLELPQGREIRVYLEDAQGTALRALSTVDGPIGRFAERIVRCLEPIAQDQAPGQGRRVSSEAGLFRVHGPVQISVNSASQTVLDAVAEASGDPGGVARVLREIRARVNRARHEGGISKEDLASAIAESSLAPPHRRELTAILTAEPVLYRMTIETRLGALSTSAVERTTALVLLPTGGVAGGSGTVILSWIDESVEDAVPMRPGGEPRP
jgi:hypothetical protein